MKPVVREWVDKAEADLVSAQREFRARKSPNYDDACFHAQQCAEKHMKALLQQRGIKFAKTHNLVDLLEMILPADATWELLRPALLRLNLFSVAYRYPGRSADKPVAREALELSKLVRAKAREALRLTV
jgi:HEPN domain-containing protein